MDAMDILGSILGHKSSKSGRGTDVLNDILRKSSRKKATSPPRSSTRKPDRRDLDTQAKELEELLNVANDRQSSTVGGSRQSQQPEADWNPPAERNTTQVPVPAPPRSNSQDHAVVLIRAMINAAKADGRIDDIEQQKIIDRLGNPTRENIDFLRSEFSKPLNLNEFVWSVPVGLEEQVYMMSLIAVDLDTGKEANYFMELSQGLRIPPEVREKIHERLGAPSIY